MSKLSPLVNADPIDRDGSGSIDGVFVGMRFGLLSDCSFAHFLGKSTGDHGRTKVSSYLLYRYMQSVGTAALLVH